MTVVTAMLSHYIKRNYYFHNIVSLPLVTIQRLDRGSTPRISTTPAKEKAALVDNSNPPGTNIINEEGKLVMLTWLLDLIARKDH